MVDRSSGKQGGRAGGVGVQPGVPKTYPPALLTHRMLKNVSVRPEGSLVTGVAVVGIDDSCRFNDDDSPRLSRTPSAAGNRRTGTISLWYKRCNLGSIMQLFNSGAGDDIAFDAANQLIWTDGSGLSYKTTQVFRDPNAWGNLVFAWDTKLATAGNRARIYHNGTEITAFATETNPDQNDELEISNTVRQTIGANESDTEEFDGYLSQVHYVDGQQLLPTKFGEFDDNGVWKPITYSEDSLSTTASTRAHTLTTGSLSDLTTYTFSSAALGTASGFTARKILVGVAGSSASGSAATVSSVTVNSVSAASVAGIIPNGTDGYRMESWIATVPSGDTGDIVVVWSTGMRECSLIVYALDNVGQIIDVRTDISSNPDVSLNTVANGCFATWAISSGAGTNTHSWTNATEDSDNDFSAGSNFSFTGASVSSTSKQAVTVTCTPSGSSSRHGQIAVSFGPTGPTWGDNGIFLDFADSSAFGNDVSGNNNDFASSGLASNDQVPDTPTKNYAVLSSINTNSAITLTNGSLTGTTTTGDRRCSMATIGLDEGKWYWEVTSEGSNEVCVGVVNNLIDHKLSLGNTAGTWWWKDVSGEFCNNGTQEGAGTLSTFTSGDVLGVAIDVDANKLWMSKNGTYENSGDPAAGSGEVASTLTGTIFPFIAIYGTGTDIAHINFGSHAFSTAAPTGFNQVNTANIAKPTILDGTAHFQSTIYTGNGSTRNIDQIGNSTFQPDIVWIKNRDTTDQHMLYDAARGVTKDVNVDALSGENTNANGLTSFDSDGFGLGTGAGGYNDNTEKFVAHQWKAGGGAGSSNTVGAINTTTTTVNTEAGISVGTYTGTGNSGDTVGHGLGVAPSWVYVFSRAATSRDGTILIPEMGAGHHLYPARTNGRDTNATRYTTTAPTTTVFSLGNAADTNTSSELYFYWAFAEIAGFSRMGLYEGNADADGPFVYCGFKPAWLWIKNFDTAQEWHLYNSAVSPFNSGTTGGRTYNRTENPYADNVGGSENIDFLSNGFKMRCNCVGTNKAETHAFMAFAEYPFGGDGVTPATTV
jgi:hypothetical protein